LKKLKTAVFPYGHTQALRDGRVTLPDFELDFIDVKPMIAAYRKMVRSLEYDVCEIPITTYTVAKAHNKGFTALPIVLNHMLHHADIQVGTDTGVNGPSDLMGKRVGVRAYTVTTGVWVRGLLQSEYGVDPSTITWYTDDEEHVQEFKAPPNVVAAPAGTSLVDLFQGGKIDAAFSGPAGIGRQGAPVEGWDKGNSAMTAVQTTRPFRPLFPDAAQRDAAWFKKTGAYPVHGLLCVKDSLLKSEPALGKQLFEAFSAAKAIYLQQLDAPGEKSADDKKWLSMREFVGGDPLPYGIEAIRPSVDMLLGFAHAQGLVDKRFTPDEIFFKP
jgi:4,5-dihydroxyphthalate decarboxylase